MVIVFVIVVGMEEGVLDLTTSNRKITLLAPGVYMYSVCQAHLLNDIYYCLTPKERFCYGDQISLGLAKF